MSEVLSLANFKPDTPVRLNTSIGLVEMSVKEVLQFFAPDAPAPDALRFLLVCKAMGLNPLLKESYLIKTKKGYETIVGIDGYLRRARSHPGYRGLHSGVTVFRPDPLELVDMPGTVFPPGYTLIGGWARVFVEGKEPTYVRVSTAEYKISSESGKGAWDTHTRSMIEKVAITHAIKLAFDATSGGYSDAEGATFAMDSAFDGHISSQTPPSVVTQPGTPVQAALPPATVEVQGVPAASSSPSEAAPSTVRKRKPVNPPAVVEVQPTPPVVLETTIATPEPAPTPTPRLDGPETTAVPTPAPTPAPADPTTRVYISAWHAEADRLMNALGATEGSDLRIAVFAKRNIERLGDLSEQGVKTFCADMHSYAQKKGIVIPPAPAPIDDADAQLDSFIDRVANPNATPST